MGPSIYTELYDNPERVHRLMELASDAMIEFSKQQFELLQIKDLTHSYHSYLMFRGGTRLCDDSATNLSSDCYEEFCKPYNEKVLQALGGGWMHFCGSGKQILDQVIGTKGVTGVNFGNPEMQDLSSIMGKCASLKIAVLLWTTPDPLALASIPTGLSLLSQAPDEQSARDLLIQFRAERLKGCS